MSCLSAKDAAAEIEAMAARLAQHTGHESVRVLAPDWCDDAFIDEARSLVPSNITLARPVVEEYVAFTGTLTIVR